MAEKTHAGWSRRTKIIVTSIVALAVLVVAGFFAVPYIYAQVMASDVPDAPTLTTDAASAPAHDGAILDPTEFAGVWRVAEGYAGYRVDEVLRGQNITVVGRTVQVSGDFVLDDAALTEGSVVVDIASIATDNGSRDGYFRSTAMQADEYPTAVFTLTEPVALPDDAATGQVVEGTATGELTMRGITQSVEAAIQVVFDGEKARVVGSIPITFADFGVEAPSLGFVEVEPDGTIEFDITLER